MRDHNHDIDTQVKLLVRLCCYLSFFFVTHLLDVTLFRAHVSKLYAKNIVFNFVETVNVDLFLVNNLFICACVQLVAVLVVSFMTALFYSVLVLKCYMSRCFNGDRLSIMLLDENCVSHTALRSCTI